MAGSTISMTNISNGDTITSPFNLNIQYTLVSAQNGSLTISDTASAGIAVTPQLATASQTPLQTGATLTYTFPVPPPSPMPPPPPPITGESITVNLMDSNENLVATQTVTDITVNPS
jgi:hypothetical protein